MGREPAPAAAPPARLRRPGPGERGSAMVETALVLPLVLAVAFGVVAAGRATHAQVSVAAAAREAGRALASAPSAPQGLAAARARAGAAASGHGLDPARLQLTLAPGSFARGGTVRARASYRVALADLPLLGLVELTVRADHVERVERYRSRGGAP